jgi:hypothetical protein
MVLIAAAVFLLGPIFLISVVLFRELFLRPLDIVVADTIHIRWSLNRTIELPFDSVSNMILNKKAPGSIMTKWSSGSIGIEGRKTRLWLSYDILMAIRNGYFAKFGHFPPEPSWHETKKRF